MSSKGSEPSEGIDINNVDEFTSRIMYVLNLSIVDTLQNVEFPIKTAVVGGQSLVLMLPRKYQLNSIDWDLHVWSQDLNITDDEARDILGNMMVRNIKKQLTVDPDRVKSIEKYFGVEILDVYYETFPFAFNVLFSGEKKYTLGRLKLLTKKFREISIVDFAGVRHEKDLLLIDGISYLDLHGVAENLNLLSKLTDYKKRDKVIDRASLLNEAIAQGDLSCNYYRTRLIQYREQYGTNMLKCISNIAIGPEDLLIPGVSRKYPRYRFDPRDVINHQNYFLTLDPATKKALFDYTGGSVGSSLRWNTQLHSRLIFPDKIIPLDPEVILIQKALLGAPRLQFDMYCYKISRFYFSPGNGISNFDYEEGYTYEFKDFNSATLDNQLNVRPFMDPFSPGIAYVMKIPRGSKGVFIIGDYSKFPGEREIMLCYGSSIKIDSVTYDQITYKDIFAKYNASGANVISDLWYDEMKVYNCTLQFLSDKKIEKVNSELEKGYAVVQDTSSFPVIHYPPQGVPQNFVHEPESNFSTIWGDLLPYVH